MFEKVEFVLHLLQLLQAGGQQNHHIVEPHNRVTLENMFGRLVALEYVNGQNQLETLYVKAEHQIVGHERKYFHILLTLQLADVALLRKYEHVSRRVYELDQMVHMQRGLVKRLETYILNVKQYRLEYV